MKTLLDIVKGIIVKNRLQNLDVLQIPNFEMDGLSTMVRLVHVTDGDTIAVVFNYNAKYYKFKIRLMGINTPELHPKDGNESEKMLAKKAKEFLITLFTNNNELHDKTTSEIKTFLANNCITLYLRTFGFDKYGRILGKIYKGSVCINDEMINSGHAVPYMEKM